MKPIDPLLLHERMTHEGEDVSLAPAAAVRPRERKPLLLRFQALLERPHADRWVILSAVVMVSTALFCGIAADDHIHRLSLRGSPGIPGFQRAFYDLFRFADPIWNKSLIDQGVFPWWADPATRLSFFRPLTSFSHALDHWLWQDNSFLSHLHSIGWFVLALLGIQKLYSNVFERRWFATLALVFYGLDDTRSGPVTWLANRNALIASSLSIWALVCFHLWRARGFKAGAWLGPVVFALSLTAGEGAIAIGGYLVAYVLCFDEDAWSRRIARILPYAAVVVAWRALSVALHYGTTGSGVYLDPVRQPIQFVSALPARFSALLLAQFAGPWSEMWNVAAMLSPTGERGLLVLAVIVLSAFALLVRPLWRTDRGFRFWMVGCLLSTIPSCATFPADRLLSWTSIGGAAALAIVFGRLIDPAVSEKERFVSRRVARPAIWSIVSIHLVIAFIMLPWRSTGVIAIRTMLALSDDSLPRTPDVVPETFVYVNPPADPFAGYVPIIRYDEGVPTPHLQRWLGTGASELEVARLDVRTLRVRQSGGYLATPSETMLRDARNVFKEGERVVLPGMVAEITSLTADQRPLEVKVTFDVPLEDASLRWFYWDVVRFKPFVLPKVGQSITLPKVDFLKLAYGG